MCRIRIDVLNIDATVGQCTSLETGETVTDIKTLSIRWECEKTPVVELVRFSNDDGEWTGDTYTEEWSVISISPLSLTMKRTQ